MSRSPCPPGTAAVYGVDGTCSIEATDDVAAVRLAERFRGPNRLELWCGERRVKSFAASEAVAG